MKSVKFSAVFLIISAMLCFTAFGAERSFGITADSSYKECYFDESKSEVSKRLGVTESELDNFFAENNVKYLAVSEDKQSQIRISVYEDGFSKKTENISAYSDNEIKKLAKKLTEGKDLKSEIYSQNSVKYIKITENLKDSGGEFTATQFITVADGKMYNVSFYGAGNKTDQSVYRTLGTFKINSKAFDKRTPIIVLALIAVGIAVFAGLISLMIVRIFKDRKTEENADENKDGEI